LFFLSLTSIRFWLPKIGSIIFSVEDSRAKRRDSRLISVSSCATFDVGCATSYLMVSLFLLSGIITHAVCPACSDLYI